MALNETPSLPGCVRLSSKPSLFCPGCGHSLILKNLGFVIDKMKIARQSIIGFDIGCSLLAYDWFEINSLQTHHGRTVPIVCGYKIAAPNSVAIAYQGDGGAYAIGLQSLLHAAHRNNAITVIVVNNTLYAMTGGQMAPTTLCGEKTTTTSDGRDCQKQGTPFLGPETVAIVSAPKSYIARGIVTNPLQMQIFFQKAIKNQIQHNSFSLIEILSMCPINWKTNPQESLAFLEKMRTVFQVGEIKCHAECSVSE